MKVGVFLLPSQESADPAIVAKRAEELGFASFWVPEHAVLPVHYSSKYPGTPDGRIPPAVGIIADPFVALVHPNSIQFNLSTNELWLMDTHPVQGGARYRYWLIHFQADGEMDSVVPAGEVTIP